MRTLTTVLALTVGILLIGIFVALSAAGTTTNPAIFLVPHQDDEILSMGADLRVHVNAGRNVQVYLLTDGSSTRACPLLGLARPACTTARDAELVTALGWMGVPPSHIHFPADPVTGRRVQDGSMTSTIAARIIQGIAANYPGTSPSWKSMRWDDEQTDHAAIGAGLRATCASVGGDCRYYLKQAADGTWPRPAGVVIASLPCLTTASDVNRARVALHSYGIAALSVPTQVALQYAHPCSQVTH